MKKILTLLLALALLLALCACGGKGEESSGAQVSSADISAGDQANSEDVSTGDQISFADVSVGDHVTFGEFQQKSKYSSDETEPIDWLVLDVQEDRVVLMADRALYAMKFSKHTWSESEPRKWLNNTFYKDAFTDQEREFILLTQTEEDTEDYVFLLSEDELNAYLPDEKDLNRLATVTSYAVDQKLEYYNATVSKSRTCNWWLRSPDPKNSLYISWVGGQAGNYGRVCSLSPSKLYGIRPVIVVKR